MGPDQSQLYSAFWHSAFRIHDPEIEFDSIYNYGVFDFDNPDFYTDFAKGYLNYKLGVSATERFFYVYKYYNRSIVAQILNLTQQEKQQLFDFLEENKKPENRYYFYDYFFNNCATKIRDVIEEVFGDRITFHYDYATEPHTIRDLVDLCIDYQPWGDFAIDLCLGSPIDRQAEPYEYMYLPFYVYEAFALATITRNDVAQPLVKDTRTIYTSREEKIERTFFTPALTFWLLFSLILLITLFEYFKGLSFWFVDVFLFAFMGLIGIVLALIWFATDHAAAANNYNLLWAMPLHLPAAILLLVRRNLHALKLYFLIIAALNVMLLLGWNLIPQEYHYAFVPIILLLTVRAFWGWWRLGD